MNDKPATSNDGSFKHWWHEFRTYAKEELVSHLPFTIFGALIGLLIVIISVFTVAIEFGVEEFHMAHYVHIFFSAAAGAAIFRSYQDSILKAIPVALVSSVGLCTLSDTLIPFVGLWIFGTPAELHVCAFAHPFLVLLSAALGIALSCVGLRFFSHCNRGFHLGHILISTVASAMYILSFVESFSLKDLVVVLVTLFFAIAIPCLIGDVTLPLCFVKIRDEYLHEKVHHGGH